MTKPGGKARERSGIGSGFHGAAPDIIQCRAERETSDISALGGQRHQTSRLWRQILHLLLKTPILSPVEVLGPGTTSTLTDFLKLYPLQAGTWMILFWHRFVKRKRQWEFVGACHVDCELELFGNKLLQVRYGAGLEDRLWRLRVWKTCVELFWKEAGVQVTTKRWLEVARLSFSTSLWLQPAWWGLNQVTKGKTSANYFNIRQNYFDIRQNASL